MTAPRDIGWPSPDDAPPAQAWADRAPAVPQWWFVRRSTLHGIAHTKRVHIHTQRLTGELHWDEADTRLALSAALWHDIGRTNDGLDLFHGEHSALRVLELGLADDLLPDDADVLLFALVHHCLRDDDAERAASDWRAAPLREAARDARTGPAPQAARASAPDPRGLSQPGRALRVLWLLKDADALDRVRLQSWLGADPAQLRFSQTAALLPFAAELFRIVA